MQVAFQYNDGNYLGSHPDQKTNDPSRAVHFVMYDEPTFTSPWIAFRAERAASFLCERGYLSVSSSGKVEYSRSATSFEQIGEYYVCPNSWCLALDDTNGLTTIAYHEICNGSYIGITNLKVVAIAPKVDAVATSTPEVDLVQTFLRDGVVYLKSSVSEEDVAAACEVLLSSKHSRVSKLLMRSPTFGKFLQDSGMKELLDKIFPDGHHLTSYSSNTLRKGVDARFWHVDYPYHDLPSPYPLEVVGVQVNFALTDFTVENGATLYVPRSHNHGRFPTNDALLGVDAPTVKHMVVPKGTIIIYRGDTWHTQGINLTDQPRCALLANFSPLSFPPKGNIANEIGNNPDVLRSVKVENGKVMLV